MSTTAAAGAGNRRGTMSNPLPCGCIRGQFLCTEAVRLWQQVNNAYLAMWQYPDDAARYDEYKDRLDDYNQHFEEESAAD